MRSSPPIPMRLAPLGPLAALLLTASPVYALWTDNGVPIGTGATQYASPAQVSDSSGGALIAWVDSSAERQAFVVRVNRIYWNGNLPGYWDLNGDIVAGAVPVPSVPVTLCEDDSGGAFVFWLDVRSGRQKVYAVRYTGDGQVAAGWPAGGMLVSADTGVMAAPRAKADGSGGALVAWTEVDSTLVTGRVVLQRLSTGGTLLWGANGVPLNSGLGSGDYAPMLAPDTTGGAWVAWDHVDSTRQLFVTRVAANGTPGVSTHFVIPGGAIAESMIQDGSGGAYLIYQAGLGDSSNIGAARITTLAVPAWALTVCAATGAQRNARIFTDGKGNLLATWEDDRGGVDWDVYAQRINPAGAATWAADGIPICTHSGDQTFPKIAHALHGASILVWLDGRSNDLYAQRVDSTGAIKWAADGIPLTTLGSASAPSFLVADGSGGALVSWYDSRAGSIGIYENKVDSLGRSGSSPVEVTSLVATAGSGAVELSWSAFTPAGTHFEVLRSESISGPFVVMSPELTSPAAKQDFTWQDRTVLPGRGYYYKIGWRENGAWSYSGVVPAMAAQARFGLHTLSANPSTGPVGLAFEVARTGQARIDIVDVNGRRVATLLDAVVKPGAGRVDWDGRGEGGQLAPAGIYFARLSQGAERSSIRIARIQ